MENLEFPKSFAIFHSSCRRPADEQHFRLQYLLLKCCLYIKMNKVSKGAYTILISKSVFIENLIAINGLWFKFSLEIGSPKKKTREQMIIYFLYYVQLANI